MKEKSEESKDKSQTACLDDRLREQKVTQEFWQRRQKIQALIYVPQSIATHFFLKDKETGCNLVKLSTFKFHTVNNSLPMNLTDQSS